MCVCMHVRVCVRACVCAHVCVCVYVRCMCVLVFPLHQELGFLKQKISSLTFLTLIALTDDPGTHRSPFP